MLLDEYKGPDRSKLGQPAVVDPHDAKAIGPLHARGASYLALIKRRALAAGINADRICCHTFRATGITAYLENGGTIEHAQAIAAHESPRTTQLYDRTSDTLNLDEIERIAI